jgi:5-methyltetrahydropteroyltriglutamate--homocysteine methyltransferase
MTMGTLFPVTTVGSWPRPANLLVALRKRHAGELSEREFSALADKAVLESLHYQEKAGVDIVTDGEQRRDSYYSFVGEKLNGVKVINVTEMMEYMPNEQEARAQGVKSRDDYARMLKQNDVPAHETYNPVAVGKISLRDGGLAVEEVTFLKQHTDKAIKVALPGPYHLHRSMWFKALSESTYPTREELGHDIVRILREELIRLRDLGVTFVQFDEPTLSQVAFGGETEETFMCAALASGAEPSYEMGLAVKFINEVVDGIDGIHTGVHVCRGNWTRREDVLLEGNYGALLPDLIQMNVNQLVLEMSTPRAGEAEVFKEYANEKEIGLGVENPRSAEVETPASIVKRAKEFLEYFEPEKIYLNPDCGFGTFAERPLNTPEIAFEKLQSMAKAARILRDEYGSKTKVAAGSAKQDK